MPLAKAEFLLITQEKTMLGVNVLSETNGNANQEVYLFKWILLRNSNGAIAWRRI